MSLLQVVDGSNEYILHSCPTVLAEEDPIPSSISNLNVDIAGHHAMQVGNC